ncbi:MAG TPA: PepSY domain-containing protein [Acidobacteriaceae bacterium]
MVAVLIAATSTVAESHVPCDRLPPAVLHQAKLEAGDATIRGCVKDRENGKLTYEVETLKDGKSRDIALDASGRVLEVEQEVAGSSLPQPVSDAIAKAAKGGKVGKIESVTRGGVIASYETTIVTEGKRQELAFNPQGAPVKAD